jgi:hypothetical protein
MSRPGNSLHRKLLSNISNNKNKCSLCCNHLFFAQSLQFSSLSTSSSFLPSFKQRRSISFNWNDDERKAKAAKRRAEIQEEINALLPKQLELLRHNTKPAEIQSPLALTSAAEAVPLVFPIDESKKMKFRNILDEELVLPDIFQGKVTLFTIAYNQHAMNHTHLWVNKWLEQFGTENWAHAYQISVINSAIVRNWFSGVTLRNTRKQFPPYRHPHTAMIIEEKTINQLQTNKSLRLVTRQLLAHILLVDGEGKVRWHAYAEPTEQDFELLSKFAKELHEESIRKAKYAGKSFQ